MQRIVIAAILLLLATPALAGEIGLTWSASDGASGYDVGIGSAPGEYTPPHTDTAGATDIVLTVPGGCVVRFFAVRAKNAAGSSGWSVEVASIARPEVHDGTFNESGLHTLFGDNFSPDVEIHIDGSSNPIGLNSVECGKITFPAAPFTTLTVTNPGDDGDLIVPFSFPLSAPGGFGVN